MLLLIIQLHYNYTLGRVFANGPGDLGSIPGRVISKTLKMELDTSLLNTQQERPLRFCPSGEVTKKKIYDYTTD